jgi:hypothetical protein
MCSTGQSRTIGMIVALGVLGGASGCVGCLQPSPHPTPAVLAAGGDIPEQCRDHVYIFVVNGLDPANIADLRGMCNYVHELGYRHIEHGQMYHVFAFARKIRRIHQVDPEARFVVIGYSMGVSVSRYLVQRVKNEGIAIDLALYLDACVFNSLPPHHPHDAERIVNVTTNGFLLLLRSTRLQCAENIHEPWTLHLGLPTNTQVLDRLTTELSRVVYRRHDGAEPHGGSDVVP